MQHADGMPKTCVLCPVVNKVGGGKLADEPQALKRCRIDDPLLFVCKLNKPVHRVAVLWQTIIPLKGIVFAQIITAFYTDDKRRTFTGAFIAAARLPAACLEM